jgi:hypothetical protein
LRRHPSQDLQPGGVLDEAAQSLRAALLVAADHDDAGEFGGAGQQLEP